MITIRYHIPDQVVTLYDYKKNKRFRGTLYFTNQYIESTPKFILPTLSLPQFTLPQIILPKIHLPLEKISRLFLGLAILSLVYIFFPPVYSELSYRVSYLFKKPQVIPVLAAVPVSDQFFLEIPKINLESAIIPNVDSDNEDSYLEKLKIGVAHAKGSYFPGDGGPVVLFSHSTDTLAHIIQYNAKFYALKDLEIGDEIKILFKNKLFTYTVSEKKIIDPTNLDALRQSNSKLILTTCFPPGTDWQRLIVYAN